MTGWLEYNEAIIAEVHAGLPASATLAERTKAVDAADPWKPYDSIERRVWAEVRSAYLRPYQGVAA